MDVSVFSIFLHNSQTKIPNSIPLLVQDVLSIFQASFIEKSDTPVDAPEAYALFATAAYLYQNPPGSQDAVLFGPMGWQT